MHRVEFGFFEILYASWEGTGGLISQCKQKYILTPLRVPVNSEIGWEKSFTIALTHVLKSKILKLQFTDSDCMVF